MKLLFLLLITINIYGYDSAPMPILKSCAPSYSSDMGGKIYTGIYKYPSGNIRSTIFLASDYTWCPYNPKNPPNRIQQQVIQPQQQYQQPNFSYKQANPTQYKSIGENILEGIQQGQSQAFKIQQRQQEMMLQQQQHQLNMKQQEYQLKLQKTQQQLNDMQNNHNTDTSLNNEIYCKDVYISDKQKKQKLHAIAFKRAEKEMSKIAGRKITNKHTDLFGGEGTPEATAQIIETFWCKSSSMALQSAYRNYYAEVNAYEKKIKVIIE